MAPDAKPARRPRFRRAEAPPPFRLTEDDVEIVRLLARHRFLRSSHIAALVNRSRDRTNDRLLRLFHAGYVDRPRAQLDYYPTTGSPPLAYALADRGARLLAERGETELNNSERSRRNREAGRPFIEHQLEVMDFFVALQCAVAARGDLRLIHPDELVAAFPDPNRSPANPFALHARLTDRGVAREFGVVPDLAFGLRFADGSRRCFLVEVDRGTMPVTRSNWMLTSFERKMRVYLAAHAAGLHRRQFGWKTFRVLIVTANADRADSICAVMKRLRVANDMAPTLFFISTPEMIFSANPFNCSWWNGLGGNVKLEM
jgi:DNA-binding Lrp family transcriptional regulator